MSADHGPPDAGATATYVYCVVVGTRPPEVSAVPAGLWGTGRPRVLDAADGFYLLVASAPRSLYDGAVIDERLADLDWVGDRATEHETVVEHATKLGTVLPMKLFTLFSSDDRAVSHIRRMKRVLGRVVDRISGCEEWGLRIMCDPARGGRAEAAGARPSNEGGESLSGTSFLRRKKASDDERHRAGARRAAAVDELYERLANFSRDAYRRAAPGELAAGVVLDSVFLVPRESVKKLKSTTSARARALVDEGCEVNLSGPWPAYSFIGGR